MTAIKNLFISHVHEDDEQLSQLRSLLKNSGYEVRNGSIDKSKFNDASHEGYIKSEILAPRIRWASTLVVLVSPNTKHSDWVNWEIEYAEKQGKRIVGVWCQGAKDADLPTALELYADAMVGWQADRLMDAVEGRINNWYQSDNTLREPQPLPRYSCA